MNRTLVLRKSLRRLAIEAIDRIILWLSRRSLQPLIDLVLKILVRTRGYGFCCDMDKTGERHLIETLSSLDPQLCIDVGANRGEYSNEWLARTSARVVAIEPLPVEFRYLQKMEQLHSQRFRALNVAASNNNGDTKIYFGNANTQLATLNPEVNRLGYVGKTNTEELSVATRTLDDIMAEPSLKDVTQIDMLKIDVEGHELEVLHGSVKTIKDLKPSAIQIEYNEHHMLRGHTLSMIHDALPGYHCFQLLPYARGLVRRDSRHPLSNHFGYANFVFLLPETIEKILELHSPRRGRRFIDR